MAKKNCNHCGKYKDEEEFNWKFRSLGVRHKTCRECIHKFNKTYFEGKKSGSSSTAVSNRSWS